MELSPARTVKARHKWLLVSGFQYWFVFTFIGYSMALFLILLIGIYVWYRAIAYEILNLGALLSKTFGEQIHDSLRQGLWLLAAVFLVLCGVSIYTAIVFSSKVAGPVHGILKQMERNESTGQWLPIKLRRGDRFQELSKAINLAVESALTSRNR